MACVSGEKLFLVVNEYHVIVFQVKSLVAVISQDQLYSLWSMIVLILLLDQEGQKCTGTDHVVVDCEFFK